jgi:hypothetical protein
MEMEFYERMDRPSAIRSGNANLRECLAEVTNAVKKQDWDRAEFWYGQIEAMASSLRGSAERNMNKVIVSSGASDESA